MALKLRGSTLSRGIDQVELVALFRDGYGAPVNLDAFPTITIQEPSGNITLGPTSAGVFSIDTGTYGFVYSIEISNPIGVYSDIWRGMFGGQVIFGTFNFIVFDSELPETNTDGYIHLGNDPGYNYSQVAIQNINKLLKALKSVLNSQGKATSTDQFGNKIFVDCNIFDNMTLINFLVMSLTDFNQIPHITFFTFDDTIMIEQFFNVLVQGAVIWALMSHALIQRGSEFTLSDSGIQFSPPLVSELESTFFQQHLANHFEKLKLIKSHLKPSPLGLGSLTISSSRNPAIARLRMLRARQIF